MKYAIFDIEANNLLEQVTQGWCLCIHLSDTGERFTFDPEHGSVEDGYAKLFQLQQDGYILTGHNIITYDIPAIEKLSRFRFARYPQVLDTLVLCRVLFTSLFDSDPGLAARRKLDSNLIGKQSLKAWGQRLGVYKQDYQGGFEQWTPEMSSYCEQDVQVTVSLLKMLLARKLDPRCMLIEHKVAEIIHRQCTRGICFDIPAAEKLYSVLSNDRIAATKEMQQAFGTIVRPRGKVRLTTRANTRLGYRAGVEYQPIEYVAFNPTSRQHVEYWFRRKYKWEPTVFTEASGAAKISEEILDDLPFPEAKVLAKTYAITKLMGFLGDGDSACLKLVGQDSIIYPQINPGGAVTGRMTHSKPNTTCTPKVKAGKDGKPILGYDGRYGYECRSLFRARPGYKLVGADASGLELRMLAHYLSPVDGGEYIRQVCEGDVHTMNQKAAGLETRDQAKTMIYAYNYGAGNAKLGSIIGGGEKEGRKIRKKLEENIPALGQFTKSVKATVEQRAKAFGAGYLIGLDGRKLHVRASYRALNTILQSGGGVVCKTALMLLDERLQGWGLVPGNHYEFIINAHDEFQVEVRDIGDLPHVVGEAAVDAFRRAGEWLKVTCPLTGEYKVGNNWAETH